MREWLPTGCDADKSSECRCNLSFEGNNLVVMSDDCSGDGNLAEMTVCRAAVVEALGTTTVDAVVTRTDGIERAYVDDAAGLLVAASRFAARIGPIDERLATRTRRDPLAAATEATGRAGAVADLAAKTGFALFADRTENYDDALRCYVGPTVSDARIGTAPPRNATLEGQRTLDTGAVARLYETPQGTIDSYHVEPPEQQFDRSTLSAFTAAHERLATTAVGERMSAHEAAVEVCSDGQTASAVGRVLAKHTEGMGILADLFADERVSDVFVTAPVDENRLRVRVDGDTRQTNVRLTTTGARAFASSFRRTSGRAFSQASPTLDASTTISDRQIRVCGVTEPVSDGLAFAFRAHDSDAWRLSDLVANGTVPPPVAGLLSVAIERGSACLVAGPRGAGKTTTLGALLWELPQSVRTLLIEDTPELPVEQLQADHRDVQALRTASGDGPSITATDALRTGLRLGEGALVVGEVRGEEASVLYEAMRVGSGDGAVLGTIHGSDSDDVRERLVTDLDVPIRSFAATDLVVTLTPPTDRSGRGIAAVEEVVEYENEVRFHSLYEHDGTVATATGRLERGNSRLVDSLRTGVESYEAVLETIQSRTVAFDPDDRRGHTSRKRADLTTEDGLTDEYTAEQSR